MFESKLNQLVGTHIYLFCKILVYYPLCYQFRRSNALPVSASKCVKSFIFKYSVINNWLLF